MTHILDTMVMACISQKPGPAKSATALCLYIESQYDPRTWLVNAVRGINDHELTSHTDVRSLLPNKLQALRNVVSSVYERHGFSLVIGGDHSIGMGTWNAIAEPNNREKMGLIWIDAHCDLHTPDTSHSGNLHGMPLGILLDDVEGDLAQFRTPNIDPKRVVIIGARSYEPEELDRAEKLGITIISEWESLEGAMDYAVAMASNHGDSPYGISLDYDFFNPDTLQCVDVPEVGGEHYSLKKLETLIKPALTDFNCKGLELVELNDSAWVYQYAEDLVTIFKRYGDGSERFPPGLLD